MKMETQDPKYMGCSKSNIFFFFRAAPKAYGGSQPRRPIRAIAAGLSQSHSNGQPTPQLMAMTDP